MLKPIAYMIALFILMCGWWAFGWWGLLGVIAATLLVHFGHWLATGKGIGWDD